jgi:hypothetical protein
MKIGQYKLANEWMREESATPEEALNTWNEMEAEFKANRAMIQEPRTMDQASLKDDLEPGPLKDELLKDFDPSQETYEEYLQRKNLERPFNMNQGGRIGFSEKPGFAKSRYFKSTLYKKRKEAKEKGLIYNEKTKRFHKPVEKPISKYDKLTADQKKYFKQITGKEWNQKDWDEGNYRRINKSRKAKDVKKKKLVSSPWHRKLQFFNQYAINQRMLADEKELAARGYISARKLNSLLGRKETEDTIDTLKGAIKESSWLNEKEGVAKWKKSKNFSFIDRRIGGQKFYKMPDKTTLKNMKDYYKNQEFLSDFKYGKIKEPSIKGAKLFYDDETLMKALKAWSGNTKEIDQNALKVLDSVFGSDNWAGPNAIKNLGRALSGEIKIEGIKVNKALGKKILDGMSRTANSKYGGSAWDKAAYTYAKDKMDMLFKNKGSKNFRELYDDTQKILIDVLGKKRAKVAIDEVISLRTGLTNDAQVYSVFSQVIDENINKKFKQSYDANLSRNFKKIREEMAKGDEANLDKIKGWTDQQNVKLSQAQKQYPGIKFANFGKFDYETGKFATPEETFGSKRFADLPSDIQKRIRKDFGTSGVSVDVGGAGTQKEVISDLSKASDELKSLKPKQQMELLKKMGYRCAKASGAGETLECYIKDVEETKAQAKKGDVQAAVKQRNAFKQAKKIPQVAKILRRGIQGVIGGVGTAIGGKIGVALEGAIEGGIYDYYRGKGYSHEQALQEGFLTKAIDPENYTGLFNFADELIEKEKIGTRWDPSGKVNLAAKYADAKSKYDSALDKYYEIQSQRPGNLEQAEAQQVALAEQEEIIRALEPSVKAGTPEYEAYQQAEERQTALMDERARDYKSKNRFLGLEWDLSPAQIKQRTPSDFKEKQILKQRERDMDEWKGGRDAFTIKPGEYIDWVSYGLGDEEGIKEKWRQIDKQGGMDLLDRIGIAGGVSNLAQGGIASLKKKW